MGILDTISHAWNTIRSATQKDTTGSWQYGMGQMGPSYKIAASPFNASSISKVVFNRIATDAAGVSFQHVKTTPDKQMVGEIKSGLQYCFSTEANIDQSAFQFFHDLVYSMCDEKAVAVVPIETNVALNSTGAFDIESMRVAKITQWFPRHVEVEIYNEDTGMPIRIKLPKRQVAILENPFAAIIGNDNSTLQRLKRKMALLDHRDEEISAGKLNMIVQLPYPLKGKTRQEQSNVRRKELEQQLKDNAYGVAYTGIDEKITQLTQPIDNDLADQVKYLRTEFYNQLGLTESIFDGTATEAEMNNYYARAIDPIITTIVQEFRRKFLTKTARSQGQDIVATRNMFNSVPLQTLASIADILINDTIATPNEMRPAFGFTRSEDPQMDQLYNRNINTVDEALTAESVEDQGGVVTEPSQNGYDLASYYFD